MISDCESYNTADSSNGWDKFLRDKCGINLDNRDTGAITGSDAGGSTIKTADSIVEEDGTLINFTDTSFTVNNLSVTLGEMVDGSVAERSFSSLSTKEKYMWQSIYTWWMKGGLDLIAESYGENFSFTSESSATTKNFYIVFENSSSNFLAATYGGPYRGEKATYNLRTHINLKYYSTASGKNGSVKNNAQMSLDRDHHRNAGEG